MEWSQEMHTCTQKGTHCTCAHAQAHTYTCWGNPVHTSADSDADGKMQPTHNLSLGYAYTYKHTHVNAHWGTYPALRMWTGFDDWGSMYTHSLIPFTLLVKSATRNDAAAAHKTEDIQYITLDSISSTITNYSSRGIITVKPNMEGQGYCFSIFFKW